jgi:hypothetical protein
MNPTIYLFAKNLPAPDGSVVIDDTGPADL